VVIPALVNAVRVANLAWVELTALHLTMRWYRDAQ